MFKKIGNLILDALFPPTEIELLLRNISAENIYQKCEKNYDSNITESFSIFKYKDLFIKDAIHELKNNKNKNAIKTFGQLLNEEILNYLEDYLIRPDYKIPVTFIPQHKSTYLNKGYNQSEELAAAIAAASTDIFKIEKLLIKIKKTKPQHQLKNRKERLQNLKGAFSVRNATKIKNKIIIVIDDVATTGATLKEARQKLLASGAFKVICFTIAH